jgi:Sigma-70, region 4
MTETVEEEKQGPEGQAPSSDLPSQPEVEKIRSRININQGRIRSKTIAGKRLTREERRLAQLIVYPGDIDRPQTRAECQSMPRPCPFVSCAHHLYLDVNPASGAIKLNFPHLEVWEMKETCALDVADRGGITLEEVGDILNLTRERIRQVEVRGLGKMRDETEGADEIDRPVPQSP